MDDPLGWFMEARWTRWPGRRGVIVRVLMPLWAIPFAVAWVIVGFVGVTFWGTLDIALEFIDWVRNP